MDFLWIIATTVLIIAAADLFLTMPQKVNKADYQWLMDFDFAHRGLFSRDQKIPENSMAAFRYAMESGYGIELDVELTSDGIPVVFHDDSLLRMTGTDKSIWTAGYEELRSLRLLGTEEKIPTFEEVLALVDGKVPLIIEIKSTDRVDEICTAVMTRLKDYKGCYCLESFHPEIVRWIRKNSPQVLRGQLSMRYDRSSGYLWYERFLMGNLLLNFRGRPQFIAYDHRAGDRLMLRLCAAFGAVMVAWTVDNETDFEKARNRFDCIIFENMNP